ncbi:MAG: hypothetical protein A3K06_03005 [Candidatus Doudnabacteria bacterium RIFCSPHIGHO2_01_52_17]|uniref:ROK family protein n=1 Tax=Candidatus Doudnabacteria bacterium RIFCSPHIGHO2_01_52_17 TaxID=1817820 RepID=A0A1F5NC30_9BACT|nr:MAG: glucokinase [Parcubacteria group bacterium GW2011_GWA2_52_8]OGE75132.1 MAG: hypothetical protein A3K06_03005 [Candidatus Doudnabacteria bacterium RIFCSPHIGHO2_01_52_17]
MKSSNKSYLGLDIGGTKIEGILWRGGKVVRVAKVRTPRSRSGFLRALEASLLELGVEGTRGIGISSAGSIDLRKGKILGSPNMRYLKNFGLRDWVAKHFKKPARLDNDAKCFLRGEQMFGQARGKGTVVALTIGTGVGGAVAVGGRLLRGSHVSAIELGHTVISRDSKGFLTLEDLISSHGFTRLGVTDPLAVQNRGFAGDRKAINIYEKVGMYLGVGLANFVNIFDPDLILLGGGIARADYLLIKPALREMRKHTLTSLKKLPPVRRGRLKNAGALGAVALFLS